MPLTLDAEGLSSLRLKQPQNGFRYNTDSILLYQFAAASTPSGRMLDVGCGCGVVGLLLARDFNLTLTGVDIQEEMIACAKENGAMNNLKARFFQEDFRHFKSPERFESIVCNPPFYSEKTLTSQNPSLRLARYRDALPLTDLLSRCSSLLTSKGSLFFCYEASVLHEALVELKRQRYHLKTLQFVHRDHSAPARLVLLQARKLPVRATITRAPIFLHEANTVSVAMNQFAQRANTLCVA